MPGSTLRATGIVTLVAAALLGSAYALGRSLVPDQPRHGTGVAASVTQPHYADQPPIPADSPEATRASPTPADGQHPAGGGEGPFGTLVSTGSPRVALTFDDGPDPRYTPQVLALLREDGVKATFCVVGENAESHPDLIQEIVAEGHTLCNHSWNHDTTLGTRPPDVIRADLLRTNEAIRAAVPGARIEYFRQPGGAWTYPVVSVCEGLGMAPLHWTVDPSDWTAPGAGKITAAVLTQTGPGSIVLMHDAGGNRAGTVEALRNLLPELMARFQLEALPTGTT
ncbi:polysaccharide deacetylase family protein [Micromonospora inositola]|uniref:Polysaccharide deacetylase n=1 Tax=Micromonospora inositola TaxID=47865 RepID=A0A1C5I6T4_9ACTN|nr:polysaccharide deacetylase family protein [Micromonospora inositola]SCG53893.1 Polysaccharide deacetylase [Micromonospora inositola]